MSKKHQRLQTPILKELLQPRLADARNRVCVLGVGAEIRGDDAFGVRLADALRERLASVARFKAVSGHAAPENCTGEIIQFRPTHLIVLDAADCDEPPGTISLIERDAIAGASFSTHTLPLKIIIDYLEKNTGCETLVLGVQPKSLEICADLSAEMRSAMKTLEAVFFEFVS